jgi:hypothetical protein
VFHTIHNYCNDVNIITISALSRIIVLGSIDSHNSSSVVDTFDTLACRFDVMKEKNMGLCLVLLLSLHSLGLTMVTNFLMLVTTVAKQYDSALSFLIFIIVPSCCHHASHITTIDNINVKPSANTVMIFSSSSNQGEKIHSIACHMFLRHLVSNPYPYLSCWDGQ